MKKSFISSLLMASAILVQAQPYASNGAERARINSERAKLEASYAAEDAACHRKFLVNNCLAEVKVRRDLSMADLRRQETAINAEERKARGAEQIRKTEEKASLEKQQEAADKRAASLRDFDSRMEREKQKNAGRERGRANEQANVDAAAGRLKNNQEKAVGRSSKQAAEAEETRKFNERLEKAKERQERYERDKAARTKPLANPLPTPP